MKEMKVVFTGFRDKKLEEFIISSGGKVTMSITRNTTTLVVKNKMEKSSGKMSKAIDLGIQVFNHLVYGLTITVLFSAAAQAAEMSAYEVM